MAYTAGDAWQQSVDQDSYLQRLREFADAREHGYYPPTILIGLGGTGAKALQHLRRMLLERLGTVELPGIAFLSIDTDTASVRPSATEREGRHPYDELIAFRQEERLDVKANFSSILENMAQHPHIREWWDDSIPITKSFNLEKGAGQLRPLSRLAFFEEKVDRTNAEFLALTEARLADLNARLQRKDLAPIELLSEEEFAEQQN